MIISYRRQNQEHGSFGIVEALVGLFLVAIAVSMTIYVTNGFVSMTTGSSQAQARAQAANAEIDLAATAVYNPATLQAVSGRSSLTMTEVPLPTMTPFAGASPIPSPVPTTAYVLTSPVYNATTNTLSGTITGNGASVPVSISQRTFGQGNCDSRLEGQTQSNGAFTTVISTPVPGCP
jgi:type II secretory pathway pseudopilin PulG